MTRFKLWRNWFKNQPFSFQWILWLILLRPFIDVFWYVKESSMVSPLQITGLLTFLFTIIFTWRGKAARKSKLPTPFIVFTSLVIFNLLLIISESPSLKIIGQEIRTITPIIIVFYMIKVMRNLERFHGLLYTYLVSSIFPLSLLVYEIFFGPISGHEVLAESRGGGYRLTGPYADMFNYLAYLIGDFLIIGYLFIRSSYLKRTPASFLKTVSVILLFAVGVKGLQHQATWVVFFSLIILTTLFSLNNNRVRSYVLIALVPLVLVAPVVLGPMFTKLFSKEIEAYSGEGRENKVLNGRFVRWDKYFGEWEDSGVVPMLFGVSISDLSSRTKVAMTGGGMHSDYVRFLFTSGIIGLIALLSFYAMVFRRGKAFAKPEKYFVTCTIVIMLLYSISSNPFGGSGNMIYILCAGMALSLQDRRVFYGKALTVDTHKTE